MEKFVIEGGERLQGTVRVGGAKNAVLPVLAATLLQEGLYRITNVPRLRDVDSMIKLLSFIGAKSSRGGRPRGDRRHAGTPATTPPPTK